MKNTFRYIVLSSAALLVATTTQAATINLSYTGTNSSGSSIEALFTIDSDDLTPPSSGPGTEPIGPGSGFGENNIALTSAQYSSNSSTTTFDVSNGYYGLDINGETTEFRTGTNDNRLQLTSIYDSIFTYDSTSGSVTYSGLYNDPALGFTDFSFSGTDFVIDLNPISTSSNNFQGFANTTSLNQSFSVDTLHISVTDVSAVPVPAAAWLFASGLIGLAGFAKRRS